MYSSSVSNTPFLPHWQTVYQIVGFDRRNFVGDVTNAVPQDEHCRILGMSFEADGVRAVGYLTVGANDQRRFPLIDSRLRIVQGLVSVTQIN